MFDFVGFCKTLVKPFGPDQLYVHVTPTGALAALKLKLPPLHKGPMLNVWLGGGEFTTTVVLPIKLLQPATLAVTL